MKKTIFTSSTFASSNIGITEGASIVCHQQS